MEGGEKKSEGIGLEGGKKKKRGGRPAPASVAAGSSLALIPFRAYFEKEKKEEKGKKGEGEVPQPLGPAVRLLEFRVVRALGK